VRDSVHCVQCDQAQCHVHEYEYKMHIIDVTYRQKDPNRMNIVPNVTDMHITLRVRVIDLVNSIACYNDVVVSHS
jgi:hypothetical protein